MNGHVMITADYKQNGRIFLDSLMSNGGVGAGEHGHRNISEAEKKKGWWMKYSVGVEAILTVSY